FMGISGVEGISVVRPRQLDAVGIQHMPRQSRIDGKLCQLSATHGRSAGRSIWRGGKSTIGNADGGSQFIGRATAAAQDAVDITGLQSGISNCPARGFDDQFKERTIVYPLIRAAITDAGDSDGGLSRHAYAAFCCWLASS